MSDDYRGIDTEYRRAAHVFVVHQARESGDFLDYENDYEDDEYDDNYEYDEEGYYKDPDAAEETSSDEEPTEEAPVEETPVEETSSEE